METFCHKTARAEDISTYGSWWYSLHWSCCSICELSGLRERDEEGQHPNIEEDAAERFQEALLYF